MESLRGTDGAHRDRRTSPVTFELAVFGWAGPDRLDIGGRWRGVRAGELAPPELVVRHDGRTLRLPALEREGPQPPPSEQWSANFEWKAGPVALDAPRLEFPDGKVVELPALRPSRLRFGRRRFAHVARDAVPGEDIEDAAPAAVRPARPDGRSAKEPPPGDPVDTPSAEALRLHAELASVRDELEATAEELERVREDAVRARHDADRASERRTADAERLHGDQETTWALARKAIAAEHAAREQAEEALRRAAADLETARAEKDRLVEELTESRHRAERAAELDRQLAEARDDARAAHERERRLREAVMAIAERLEAPPEHTRPPGAVDGPDAAVGE
jgi:hypothetical protein